MSNYHPTKELLIQCVIDLMKDNPESSITSDQVLQISGISKGSMYHHFLDFQELIESANAYIFKVRVDDSIAKLRTAISISRGKADFLDAVKMLSHGNHEPALVAARFNQINCIAKSVHSEHMRELMAFEEQRFVNGVADVIREAQERGWATKELDPQVVASFYLAISIGRVVDYLSDTPMPHEDWIVLVDQVLHEVVFI